MSSMYRVLGRPGSIRVSFRPADQVGIFSEPCRSYLFFGHVLSLHSQVFGDWWGFVHLLDLMVVQLSPLPVVFDRSIDPSKNFTFENFRDVKRNRNKFPQFFVYEKCSECYNWAKCGFVNFNFCVRCDVLRPEDVVQPVETTVPFQDSL
jgi:hypothetical protein